MKLLMIIVDTDCREELEVLLRRNDVFTYSEIPAVLAAEASSKLKRAGCLSSPCESYSAILTYSNSGPFNKGVQWEAILFLDNNRRAHA